MSTACSNAAEALSFVKRRQKLRQKRRSQTTSVLILLMGLVVVFLPLSHHRLDHTDIIESGTGRGVAAREQDDAESRQQRRLKREHTIPSNGDFSDFSCEDVYKYPSSIRCAFAHTCNGGDGIAVTAYFCQSKNRPKHELLWLNLSLILPLVFLLIVLFRILGSTAEEFFSPGLEMLSVKLHIPERFAGVTLLSLGNGAPDVASTVSALLHDRKRGYLLALGELTGAAMVASTLIVGAVVACSDVSVGTALVRDIVFFMITMLTVYLSFNDGTISHLEIQIMGGLYVGYVLIVLVADIYQRRVVLARRRKQKERNGECEDTEQPQPNETSPLVPVQTPSPCVVREKNRGLSVGTYELNRQKEANGKKSWKRGDSWIPEKAVPMMHRMIRYLSNYDNSPALHNNADTVAEIAHNEKIIETNSQVASSGWGDLEEDGTDPLIVFHPHHGGIVDLKHSDPTGLEPVGRNACRELNNYLQSFWNESFRSTEYNALDKILMLCELPVTILRMVTIPVPCDGYYCRPLLALSIALCPVWLWYYFREQFDIYIEDASHTLILISFLLPALIAVLVFQFAPSGDIPPRLSVAVPLTMVGFVASAAWLDFLADKIVSLLEFFGIICGIPSTIMGLTVLAWGNSSQDLIANMTVAKKGLSTMAVTASFAGPVFNMLVGLCIGLSLLKSANPNKEIVVSLDNTLRVGFFYCCLNGILVIISGVCIGKGVLPKKYGIVAAVVYFTYVVASLGA